MLLRPWTTWNQSQGEQQWIYYMCKGSIFFYHFKKSKKITSCSLETISKQYTFKKYGMSWKKQRTEKNSVARKWDILDELQMVTQ